MKFEIHFAVLCKSALLPQITGCLFDGDAAGYGMKLYGTSPTDQRYGIQPQTEKTCGRSSVAVTVRLSLAWASILRFHGSPQSLFLVNPFSDSCL